MSEEKIYEEQNKVKYNVKAIMFTLLLGSFISLVNETILNVAFPKLMVQMNVTATTVQWLTTGYVLVVGILVPVTAFLINTFTTKKLYLAAMTLFLIGTVSAIFSKSFTALLISRLIQASGTGMLIPIMTNAALAITPREKHGSVMGLCVAVISLGPALGPVISGILLQFSNWHSLFIMILPFLLVCMICGYIFLKNTSVITKPTIDYLSIVLSCIGFAGIIYSVSEASTSKISNTVLIFAIGIIALVLFVKRQLKLKQPMLEIRAFKNHIFTTSIILIVLIQMLQFSVNIMLPMLVQDGLKTSSLESAFTLFPAIILSAILTPFIGKIYDIIGGSILIPSGFFVMALFGFVISRVTASTSVLTITLLYCIIMVGQAMAMSTSQTTALSQLPNKNRPDGVAIVNTSMQIAGALGSSLYVGIMTAYENKYLNANSLLVNNKVNAIYSGFGHSLTTASILISVGFVLSLTLKINSKNNK